MYGLKIGSNEKSVLLRVRTVDNHTSSLKNLMKQEKRSPYSEILLARLGNYSGQECGKFDDKVSGIALW